MASQPSVYAFDAILLKSVNNFNKAQFVYPQQDDSETAKLVAGVISLQIRPDLKYPGTMIFVTIRFTEPGMQQNFARHVKIEPWVGEINHDGAFNRFGVVRMPYVKGQVYPVRLTHTPNRSLRSS